MSEHPRVLDARAQHHGTPHHHAPMSPLLLIHRYLRGRYRLACALALVLAVGGAVFGWLALPPVYTSRGIIRVAPTLPKILYETEENQLPKMFDAFVEAQATFLKSRRVLDRAVTSIAMREAGWPDQPDGISLLDKSLKIDYGRGAQLILVNVSHSEPRLSQVAVDSVLEAYRDLYGEQSGLGVSATEQTLVERQSVLERELTTLRDRIFRLADEHGTDTLDRLHAGKIEELQMLERRIAELHVALASAPDAQQSARDDAGQSTPGDIRELAGRDESLAVLLDMHEKLQRLHDDMSLRFGPNHREIKDVQRRIGLVQTQIDTRLEELQSGDVQLAGSPDTTVYGTRQDIEEMISRLRTLREQVWTDAQRLGRTRQSIAALSDEAIEKRQLLDETRRRLETLRVENTNSRTGRVTVAAQGDLPIRPSTDRRAALAMLGALGGGGAGIALVVLLGLFQRQFRFIDEFEEAGLSAQVIGILPQLETGDAEQCENAALSVHHIRNRLQSQRSDGKGGVIAVTSGQSGDGKTSLVAALGSSFALAGERTLLIDLDLVGRGLSRHLEQTGAEGVAESLRVGEVNGHILPTPLPNLSVLPAGADRSVEAIHLSPGMLRRMIDEVRGEYECILIDTGPVLGSLEANVLAPLCDRVLLVVSRGNDSKIVRSCLSRLAEIGAKCGGLVFNRAAPNDIERSLSHASLHSRVSQRSGAEAASKSSNAPEPSLLASIVVRRSSPGPATKAVDHINK